MASDIEMAGEKSTGIRRSHFKSTRPLAPIQPNSFFFFFCEEIPKQVTGVKICRLTYEYVLHNELN